MVLLRSIAAAAALLSFGSAQSSGNGTNSTAGAIYKDPSASIEDRVSDLLSRMTIEDKMAQLMQGDITNWMNQTDNSFNYTGLVENMKTKQGMFYVGYPVPQQWISQNVKKAQDYLLQNTTLGIPAIVQTEGIHGFLIGNATIFNSPIAFACSFNPDLVKQMAEIIAKESLALGVNQLFAPVMDLGRELRFGRVEEGFGEDHYLSGEMGYAYVTGLQSHNVSATVKHFAGFSAPEQGINLSPVHGGEREMRTTWLPSFKRAIIDAGAYAIMSAYHAYDGMPAIVDHHYLTDVLRGEWGYKYFVTSDAGGTDRICNAFKMCKSSPIDMEAVTMFALPAGNDVEMGGGSFNFRKIPELVESGKLDESVVDTAVSRLLRAKFTMGIFEHPYRALPANQTASVIHTNSSLALARKLDAESIVLLENHDSLLPLDRSANVALIGPMGDGFMNYGDYVVYRSQYHGATPLQGLRNASSGTVSYSQGCERWSSDESGFDEAVAAAKAADVAVVVVGTWSRDQMELWQGLNATTGEHVDVHNLNLVGAQAPLVKAIIDTGKPTVVVFSSGKPITEPWISDAAGALVQQFYPSEMGGHALADVLYGKHNPSGRLSVSFPHDVGNTPIYYDYLNSGRYVDPGRITENGTLEFGHQYVLSTPAPLYEFGYGLSYTTFKYSNVSLSSKTASADSQITATVSVTNNGTRDGQEVVQAYSQDVISSVAVPNLSLRGFKKVMIKAGQTVQVEIPIDVSQLGVWDVKMKYVVEPGDFVIWVGSSSADLKGNATFTVT